MRVAAVDVGTNTVRLLVADIDGELIEVERDQRITRLGEGVDADRRLGGEPMQRTLRAVEGFAERAKALGSEAIRVVGTSALRDARNTSEFEEEVRKAAGLDVEILDGHAEGRAAYAGATSWLGEGSYVVCDIGGGSTELITSTFELSADVGSVRVRERLLRGDPPAPAEISAARSAIRSEIEGAADPLRIGDKDLVGVAGTITTLAALAAGLDRYEREVVHGYRLTADDVHTWAARLNASTVDEIKSLGPVESGRADVIGAGALVLETVFDVLAADELLVSERDILDGLALGLVR